MSQMANTDRDRFITEQELSKLVGRSLQTLRNDRHRRRGVNYYKVGRSVRYRLSEVQEFMQGKKIVVEDI